MDLDPDDAEYTFIITKVDELVYYYGIYEHGKFTQTYHFGKTAFEEFTRKLTKLERALK